MRGHAKDSNLTQAPAADLGFCRQCGAPILGRCPSCNIRIRGREYAPGVWTGEEYEPPRFCDGCGEPFPWADWQDRIYQLENLLDFEPIDDATRLLVQQDLARLRSDAAELNDEAQLTIWRRVKERAPSLFRETALPIFQSIASAYILQKMGIPPAPPMGTGHAPHR